MKTTVAIYYDEETKQHTACYKCPCGKTHCIPVKDGPHIPGSRNWGWNGNTEKPTFIPSLLTWTEDDKGNKNWVCHSNVIDGVARFCGDSTHKFANQHVELPEWKALFDDE